MNIKKLDRIAYAIKPLAWGVNVTVAVALAYHFAPVATLTLLMCLGVVAAISVPPAVVVLLFAWVMVVRLRRYDRQQKAESAPQIIKQFGRSSIVLTDTVTGELCHLTIQNGALTLTTEVEL